MVEGGATTVWETYIMYDEENHQIGHSMNHYSPGSVCAYLFNTVCGIRITDENEFEIKPLIGGILKNARDDYLSPYGKVIIAWEKNSD